MRLGAGEDVRLPPPCGFVADGEVVFGDPEAATYEPRTGQTSVTNEVDAPAVPPRSLKTKAHQVYPDTVEAESFEILQ